MSKSEEEVDSLKRNLADALLLKDNLNTYVEQVKELQSEIERLKLENSVSCVMYFENNTSLF